MNAFFDAMRAQIEKAVADGNLQAIKQIGLRLRSESLSHRYRAAAAQLVSEASRRVQGARRG
ncbi:hypothetical protein GCM10012275_53230 [Longimycelium tulufanense]|uniref:Uncharacterized protein n=1 Tax=Longimycelium tulufanense TaxID=907463 RepID=A0A8J3FYY4_9PSEU|nr:hypothetical protein [Longimycelium tulufanense]GGM75834.1 hypothetical protein GCM10012275_53230 [Longimycelium tulufanense]